jgi:hypothetical protein
MDAAMDPMAAIGMMVPRGVGVRGAGSRGDRQRNQRSCRRKQAQQYSRDRVFA